MFDLDAVPALCAREITAIADRARDLSAVEWSRPIPFLPGWTIGDLVDHAARASGQQAVAIENGLRGSDEQPAFPHPEPRAREAVLDAMSAGRDALVEALTKITPDDLGRTTPMPFGVVPTPVATTIAVLEYAFHRWDLERALDADSGYDLPDDIAPHALEFLMGFVPVMAAGGIPPTRALTIALRTPAAESRIGFDGTAWAPSTASPDCTVIGSASDLTMFTLGRVGSDAAAIEVAGDRSIAEQFKSYAPGP